jgi:CubicO group peptidase (beta-lactamase class C family)
MLKKIAKAIGIFLLIALLALNGYVVFSGKIFFYKALAYNFAGVDDYKIFENRTLHKSQNPQPWPVSSHYNKGVVTAKLQHTLDTLETFAFLVIKEDSLLHEVYSEGYGTASFSNSFSVAKSVVSILIGVALKEGKIKNIDQPVGDFLEDFRSEGKEKITLRHLLTMSSGLNWDESYSSPFSMTTEAYYGKDLPGLIHRLEAVEEPGVWNKYLSGNTEVLALVLEKATGKHVGEYAEEKLWGPLGMENDALWSLDKENGTEKAYCCLNSNARDFAKIGELYLHLGNWKGAQIVDTSYVKASVTPASFLKGGNGDPVDFYGYQWWLIPDFLGLKIFYARGILGQYIIVVPEKKMIIVRLGHKRGKKQGEHVEEVFTMVEEALTMMK